MAGSHHDVPGMFPDADRACAAGGCAACARHVTGAPVVQHRPANHIETTGDNEGTAYPRWAIVDPRQRMVRASDSVDHVASQITGPFFSRASAEQTLSERRYRFGKHAKVYCFSGHMSPDYKDALVGGGK